MPKKQKVFFQNEYVMTKKLIKEYVYSILYRNMIIRDYFVLAIALILFLVTKDKIVLFLIIALLLIMILTPIISVKQIVDRNNCLCRGKTPKSIIKFSDNIIIEEEKTHQELDYNQIKEIVITKSFYYLKLGKRVGLLVLRNGFTVGDSEEFVNFIENKITE